MAKKKQEVKLKEPVRIRFKQLANGNQSIYLDYYTGDVIRKENYVGGWKSTKIISEKGTIASKCLRNMQIIEYFAILPVS